MKLAIACHRFGYGGGMERYTMDLVRGLNQLGVRPLVFARGFDTAIPEYAYVDPVRINVRALPSKLRDHYFSSRVRTLKDRHGVDVLIGCSRTAVSDIAICGGTHRGFLAHLQRSPKWSDRWQIQLETHHYAHARQVVAHSGFMARELEQYYNLPADKLHVAYPPVDTTRFVPVAPERRLELRRALDIPEEQVAFLFPSTGHGRKGYEQLASFFQRTALPVCLLVAGRPVDSQSPRIRYIGYRQDIEDCYRAADFTILASRYEPFGLVGPESVLCGTPAVLPRDTGCAEVLSREACVTFDLDNPASLATAIAGCVAQVGEGRARLSSPPAHLSYAPDVLTHARIMLDLALAQARG